LRQSVSTDRARGGIFFSNAIFGGVSCNGSNLGDIAVGKVGFIDQYDLWNAEQRAAVPRVIEEIDKNKLEMVRVSVPDSTASSGIRL